MNNNINEWYKDLQKENEKINPFEQSIPNDFIPQGISTEKNNQTLNDKILDELSDPANRYAILSKNQLAKLNRKNK